MSKTLQLPYKLGAWLKAKPYRCLVVPNDWRSSEIWSGTDFTVLFENNPEDILNGEPPVMMNCIFAHTYKGLKQVPDDIILDYFNREILKPGDDYRLAFKKSFSARFNIEVPMIDNYGIKVLFIKQINQQGNG